MSFSLFLLHAVVDDVCIASSYLFGGPSASLLLYRLLSLPILFNILRFILFIRSFQFFLHVFHFFTFCILHSLYIFFFFFLSHNILRDLVPIGFISTLLISCSEFFVSAIVSAAYTDLIAVVYILILLLMVLCLYFYTVIQFG